MSKCAVLFRLGAILATFMGRIRDKNKDGQCSDQRNPFYMLSAFPISIYHLFYHSPPRIFFADPFVIIGEYSAFHVERS